MFQIVSAAELAALADGVGIEGSLGVIYQLRDTGVCYEWNPATGRMDLAGGDPTPAVSSGVWRQVQSVTMRVRITGTGTVSMDSATGNLGAGTVTTDVYTASPVGVQIDDFSYPGDTARSIRFTLTGSAAVEVY